MPCLVFGSALAFFSGARSRTQFAGRSKAPAHCLALEGSLLGRSQARIVRTRAVGFGAVRLYPPYMKHTYLRLRRIQSAAITARATFDPIRADGRFRLIPYLRL